MATREQLNNFLNLSRKEQLDAAFNAGATSLDEANAAVDTVVSQAQGGAGQGFLGTVRNRLNNLTPAQGRGLLAFGAAAGRGIQPGETLISTLASAAQQGLSTTEAARALRAEQDAARRAELQGLLKFMQKNREIGLRQQEFGLDERRFGLEQQEFERDSLGDPRLSKIDPFDFTPDSVQRFIQSGNFADLVPNPSARRGTNVNVNTGLPFKIPSGFMLNDPNNPASGVVPIPGGPAATLTPEQSAKAQLVQGSIDNATVLDRLLFDPDGTPNRTQIANMNVPFGGTPFTEGRTANALLKDAVEAKIRAESGAAVPESEVIRAMERFKPSVLDSDETIKTKRALLNQFLQGTYDKFDPTGTFKRNETLDALIKDADKRIKEAEARSAKQSTLPAAPVPVPTEQAPRQSLQGIDFNTIPMEDLTDEILDKATLEELEILNKRFDN